MAQSDGQTTGPGVATTTVLLAVSSLTVMAGATIAPALPGLALHFAEVPNAAFLAQLVLTMPAIIIALCAPFAGALVDRAGARRVLLGSVALYVLGGSSGLVARGFGELLAGRAVLGVGVAGLMTGATALIGSLFTEERRATILGYQAAAMAVGGVVFLTLGGQLAEMGWRYPFWIYALPVALLPSIAHRLPDRVSGPERNVTGATIVIPWREIGLYCAIAFAAMTLFYVVPTQSPFLLAGLGIEDAAYAGYAIAISTATTAVTAFFFGKISKTAPAAVTLVAMFGALGGGLVLASCAESLAMIAVALMLVGVGAGLILPAVNGLALGAVDQAAHGRVSGAISTSVYLGQFASPAIFAVAAGGHLSSGMTVFGAGGVAMGLLTGAWAAAFHRMRRNGALPPS